MKGHKVTVVTPFKSKTTVPGAREIIVESNIQEVFDAITDEEFVKGRSFMMPIGVQVDKYFIFILFLQYSSTRLMLVLKTIEMHSDHQMFKKC